MSTFTENYTLIKPDEADYYDVQDFNENMDTIDTQMAATALSLEETQEEVAGVSEKIGTSTDTGSDTVFGKLTQLAETIENNIDSTPSVVKSIQHVVYTVPASKSSGTVSIASVTAKKCFVIMERLQDETSGWSKITYTLSASSISVSHSTYNSTPGIKFGFWVVEFY